MGPGLADWLGGHTRSCEWLPWTIVFSHFRAHPSKDPFGSLKLRNARHCRTESVMPASHIFPQSQAP